MQSIWKPALCALLALLLCSCSLLTPPSAAEQAAQCVTAEQLVEKYARADVLTDEMAECMVEAVLVGRPERQRRPVPLEIRWRF